MPLKFRHPLSLALRGQPMASLVYLSQGHTGKVYFLLALLNRRLVHRVTHPSLHSYKPCSVLDSGQSPKRNCPDIQNSVLLYGHLSPPILLSPATPNPLRLGPRLPIPSPILCPHFYLLPRDKVFQGKSILVFSTLDICSI
jgi:hypothetical protein